MITVLFIFGEPLAVAVQAGAVIDLAVLAAWRYLNS